MPAQPSEFSVERSVTRLAGEQSGEGMPIVLLHGLSATRRYVVMGSRALERCGHRVISYDARGHGRSSPSSAGSYTYEELAEDLVAVLDQVLGTTPVLLAGASMGAHTAARLALSAPARVAALALITPAFDPEKPADESELSRWDELAAGLRENGVEGFIAAYDLDAVPARWRSTLETVLRQRLSAHEHPSAVADALEAVPRSRPFESFGALGEIAVPTDVIASRDEADPGHPLALGERYAAAIGGSRLLVEPSSEPPASPLAWQGGQLSKAIAELAARTERGSHHT